MLPRLRSRLSTEALVFGGATALALAHAFDDAFLLPGPGVPLTQHALAAGIALAASVLAIVRFASLRPGVRAALAFTFGALALVAGTVLVGLAAWIPFRHRGEGVTSPAGRLAIRAAVVVVGVLSLPF